MKSIHKDLNSFFLNRVIEQIFPILFIKKIKVCCTLLYWFFMPNIPLQNHVLFQYYILRQITSFVFFQMFLQNLNMELIVQIDKS